MSTMMKLTLDEVLAREYPFNVIADPDGGYVIVFPDLSGCMTQVETLDEVGPMAEEIRTLWLETEYDAGDDIPVPSYPEEYSGKFLLRIPKSLHRTLTVAAEREGVSLNVYACQLLGENHALMQVMHRMDGMEEQLRYSVTGIPSASQKRGTSRKPETYAEVAEVKPKRTRRVAAAKKAE